jgi:hypothetical protein
MNFIELGMKVFLVAVTIKPCVVNAQYRHSEFKDLTRVQ